MIAELETTLVQEFRRLTLDQQQQVLSLVLQLAEEQRPQRDLWDDVDEYLMEVPTEVWDQIPSDSSDQHDHYLYGSPKQ